MLKKISAVVLAIILSLMTGCSKGNQKSPDEIYSEYLSVLEQTKSVRDENIDVLLSERASQYKNNELEEMFGKVPKDKVASYERIALKILQAPLLRPTKYETVRNYGEDVATLSFHYDVLKSDETVSVVEQVSFVNEGGWKIDRITKTTKTQSMDGKSSSETTEQHF